MKNISKILLSASAAMASCFQAASSVKLPPVLGDNMVLQQNTEVRLWGETSPGKRVTVSPSWSEKVYETRAGADGCWEISIGTPSGSYEPREITFSDGEKTTVGNILIGEVWFCSGQSNMEMPMNGFWNCPVENSNTEIACSGRYPGIRMATIPKTGAYTPQESVDCQWMECTPANARWFSATAYHFGKMVNNVLDVPVGLIVCSWGGSCIEGWLPEETVARYEDVDLASSFKANDDGSWDYGTPVAMYNGMLHPLRKYTIRGFLWYQGESNVGRHKTYADRLVTLAGQWREEWGLGELPFGIVEIAPYSYGGSGMAGALLREAQHDGAQRISNSGYVCTNDLVYPYEDCQIHPCRKTEVGERLAFWALNKVYGLSAIECESPSFREMRIEGNRARIFFNADIEGFSPWHDISGFEIAGDDKVFHPAEARLDTDTKTVIVSSEAVPSPAAVRYGFRDFFPGNLKSTRGLPVIPFRTDRWE